MVNVSRGKNEYGHHLLHLSLRSVHVRVCTFVYDNPADTHAHNVLLERDLEIWNGRKGREEEREEEAANTRETCNKTCTKLQEETIEVGEKEGKK